MKKPKKILILGSGALKIGEAGEFDYSGSQAIKALKEEGIHVVLVNPNIATVQTSRTLADEVYFLPITPYFVEQIIAKEKPDGILLSFGGQTALNCGMELHKTGVLKKHNVHILGTPISAIILTEDRDKFAKHLATIAIPTPASHAATTVAEAVKIAKEEIGFPVMIRAGFALGGHGSGIAKTERQLKKIAERALSFAPQILIEQYLHHYKEIEYEVVRDKNDNCITVCNMENMDPLGIHTGESVVVAPSQTLDNEEYHQLRKASIDIVRSLGIVGECNVQFALNPKPKGKGKTPDYYVIEVNARLSRSSALASKATGYPLAYVAAKLVLGYNLTTLKNKVTGVTSACFEPALDYIVTKIPRWDLDKFKEADQKLGSSMKSVGEVMGIGRTFEESFQKALRMLDMKYEGVQGKSGKKVKEKDEIKKILRNPTPKRLFAIAHALRQQMPVATIHRLSGIDPWFIHRIKHIVDEEDSLKRHCEEEQPARQLAGQSNLKTGKRLSRSPDSIGIARNDNVLTKDKLLKLKQLGISDKRIGELVGKTGHDIRALRKKHNVLPVVLQIDTLAGEFPAQTNYLYMTYNANHYDLTPSGKKAVIVLGSGPYHIGSSVEFDWCSVNTVESLKKYEKQSIIINCNPETVSTDYDISDRLYFEELTFERIADIYEYENPLGTIVSVGGQTPNNRAKALHDYGVTILGTNPDDIDRAENRNTFSALLDTLNIQQPAWQTFSSLAKAEQFAEEIGYPVLIRPSYVLSGSAMNVCFTKHDLEKYLEEAAKISQKYPITVSNFFHRAKEIELDAVAQKGKIKAAIISEHIEYAGVHSGDATIVLPTQTITKKLKTTMTTIAKKLAKALNITGPFNIQFLVKDENIYIIEINLRASRTFPFIAKVTGTNLISLFVDALFTPQIPEQTIKEPVFTAVKVAQFSFARLIGAHPKLGVEMASTGEVACFGEDVEEAYLKGMLATGGSIPKKGIFVSLGGEGKKQAFINSCQYLTKLGLPIYATEHTALLLNKHGVKAKRLYKIHDKQSPTVIDYFRLGKIDVVINVVDAHLQHDLEDGYVIRRAAIDNNILVLTKLKQADLFLKALVEKGIQTLAIKSWSDYTKLLNKEPFAKSKGY